MYADAENQVFNMVCEIPRWTNAKMEIATAEKLNPIKQDVKKGKVRFVDNVFPHKGYIWNYGAIPQTWENPNHVDPGTNAKGDNDPIDICEIGQRVCERGEIIQVKILGTIALIDEGETDWKLMAININDPLASQLNDINDIEKVMPGFLRASREWFQFYKVPTGKPENKFAFDGQYKNKEFALKVLDETHGFWKANIANTDPGTLVWANTTVESSPHLLSADDAKSITSALPPLSPPTDISPSVDKWHYIKG
jgi:inorganic pyrophosphatase